MKVLLNRLGTFLGSIISLILCEKPLFKLYNFFFEHSPYPLIKIFVRFIDLPNVNSKWLIYLPNNKQIITKIYKDDIKSKNFALSYKWHSPALNFSEYLLINYYNIHVPWIDIGANLGLRSLLALSEYRPVYFIEPNKELNEINYERCRLNKFINFTFIECGVSDKIGEAVFYIDNTSYNSSIEPGIVSDNSIDRVEKIRIDTIDNIFKNIFNKLETAILKIDVEGHELNVLRGANDFISQLFPTIIIEVNEKGEHFLNFIKIMKIYNYQLYEIAYYKSNKYYKKIDQSLINCESIINSNDFIAVKDPNLIRIIDEYSVV